MQDNVQLLILVSRARSIPQGGGQGLGQLPLLGESFRLLRLPGLPLLLRQL